MALKRLTAELKQIDSKTSDSFTAGPRTPQDMLNWEACIFGPKGTPYEDGSFFLDLKFASDYPFKPPKVAFRTKIYHLNVSAKTGEPCLGILKDEWSPSITVSTICEALGGLMSNPEPDNPVEVDIAVLYTNNRKAHDAAAKAHTAKHAM